MAAGAGDLRDRQDGGARTAVERILVCVGSVSLAGLAASLVAAAYWYALAVGVRNGLWGSHPPREFAD